jgi:hypothetical protein
LAHAACPRPAVMGNRKEGKASEPGPAARAHSSAFGLWARG